MDAVRRLLKEAMFNRACELINRGQARELSVSEMDELKELILDVQDGQHEELIEMMKEVQQVNADLIKIIAELNRNIRLSNENIAEYRAFIRDKGMEDEFLNYIESCSIEEEGD